MSIRDRLIDATVLWRNERREGALLSVLVALAATSRKRYPRPQYGDKKAFVTFLSDETLRLTAKVNWIPSVEWTVTYNGHKEPFAEFLYTYLRCELAHEGKLPPDIEFGLPCIPVAMMPTGNKLLIHRAVIVALSEIVLEVPENDGEFAAPADGYTDLTI